VQTAHVPNGLPPQNRIADLFGPQLQRRYKSNVVTIQHSLKTALSCCVRSSDLASIHGLDE
jgi:hypothetical protein